MLTAGRADLIVTAAIGGLVIAISYTLASAIWTFLHGVDLEVDDLSSSSRSEQVAPLPEIDIRRLVSWQLFGKHQERAVKKRAKTQTVAPKTNLRLELQGVFHGDNAEDSTAIIAESGKGGALYHVGDKISGGVKLDAVYSDRVILLRNGKLEALYFIESFKPGSSGFKINNNGRQNRNRGSGSLSRSSRSKAPMSNAKSKLGRMVASGNNYSSASIVKAIAEDLEKDPEAALAELGLESKESGGYAISKTASRDLMRSMGLRSGDTILSVNGQALGGSVMDADVIQSALGGGKVRVEIQRGSRRFTVSLDVPKI